MGLYWYYVSGPFSKGIQRTIFGTRESLTIQSDEFSNGQSIPIKYTCEGEDINPSLVFSAVPLETKSLAIIVEDLDSKPQGFTHWIIFNIRPILNGIEENSIPDGASVGINDFLNTFYDGPCPTVGTHHYVFKLYALDTLLDLGKGSTKQQVQNAMGNHVLEEAELTGLYKKIRP